MGLMGIMGLMGPKGAGQVQCCIFGAEDTENTE